MTDHWSGVAAAAALILASCADAAAPDVSPWDALTPSEIRATAAAVRRDHPGPLIFNELKLARPDKAAALAWRPGALTKRRADVVFMQDSTAYEGTVDLASGQATVSALPAEVQPMLSVDGEIQPAMTVANGHPQVVAALARRGLQPDEVVCAPMTVGRFPGDAGDTRRLAKLWCLKAADKSRHLFSQPVEGLIPVLDLERREIVEVIDLYPDTTPPPVPELTHEFDESSIPPRPALNAVRQATNGTPNYQRDGSRVTWQNWDFRLSYDPRQGTILNDVAFQDGKRRRSVIYEVAMSEMFVPYQDPTPGWYFRTYFDMGEYGFGNSGTELSGADCPSYAEVLDVTLHDAAGEPVTAARRVCLFERDPARPIWRHTSLTGSHESRPATELVVRMAATIGNYDYFQDYVLAQDGRFRVELTSTGLDAVKGVAARSRAEALPGELDHGTLIAPQLLGVNHDHFFNYRVDLDVDGPVNEFVRLRLVPQAAGNSPRTSYWRVEPETVTSELAARTRLDPNHPAALVIRNPASRNAMGEPASFQIIHQTITRPLVDPSDPAYQRGAFTFYDLWVTRHARDERFASGRHINQGIGGQGLPAWTAADRKLANADVVAWVTLGFHHVPMAEDWPVMPAKVDAFELKPRNFFDRNPAIDVPTEVR
ncbi:MAG: hypothetical protein RIC56_10240 [Pseudomonadales bacterium]